MLPKFAETGNAQRISPRNRTDIVDFDQRVRELGGEGWKKTLYETREVMRLRDEVRAKFDKEANEKDLVGRNRRGMEAALEYKMRRDAGIKEVNERDDPNSPYSLQAIEDGLMTREAIEGVEYATIYSEQGEVIGVFKGEKGSVGVYVDQEGGGFGKIKNGTLTHSHPTDGADRPFGMVLSGGDIKVHAARELLETRAVAREGTYSMRAKIEEVRIPEALLRTAPESFRKTYEAADAAGKGRMAFAVLAQLSETGSRTNPLQRAGNEVAAGFARQGVTTGMGRLVQNSEEFMGRQVGYQKGLMESFGIKYDFKPNAGYESIAQRGSEVAKGFNVTDHAVGLYADVSPQQLTSRLNGRSTPVAKPSVIAQGGNRDDAVLARYRTPPVRTAPPPASAPSVKSAGSVAKAAPTRAAPKVKTAPEIKAAPKTAPRLEPPTAKSVDEILKGWDRARENFRGLGRLRSPELPSEVFGD